MEISSRGNVVRNYYCLECVNKNPEIRMMLEIFSEKKQKRPEKKEKVCPFCGITLRELKDSGFAGCAKCYRIFRPFIRRKIKRMHNGFFHRGKFPVSYGNRKNILCYLEDRMRQAVSEHNFEEIEKIRKEFELFMDNG